MTWTKPTPDQLRQAIGLYLRLAYPGAAPPAAVLARIESLPLADALTLFNHASLERDPPKDPNPHKYQLRLGNARYPHMKLVIERAPDGRGHLFRADTHDRHVRPREGSPEAAQFRALMEFNQQTADRIESAWAQAGLPTFKTYLRADLARRAASAP